jgi:adenine-specific DNA-methyltransferase
MKLYETLEAQLRKEPNYVTDSGELKKWVIINKAQNYDAEIIALLLDDKELKTKFFIDIKGVLVFNQSLFIQFLEQKNYLNDSYTAYKNKVGLNIDGKYLKQRNEVALVWPFKDCVLEGGLSREEEKREEIFFNETLAQDEINQLLEPKVFTNSKIYSAEGEKTLGKFNRNEKGIITDSIIVKGNNLLALHTLKEEFAGQVKLIYIDPPYNRDADAFYNDNFKNSTWLTFMKNRLEIAKELLIDDGFFFIQIDDYQLGYLKILCDEVFNRENAVNIIAVKMSETSGVKMAHVDKKLPKIKEFILSYRKNNSSRLNPIKIKKESQGNKLDDYLKYYKKVIENYNDPVEEWIITSINEYLKKQGLETDEQSVKNFQLENAERVVYRTNNKSFENLNVKGKLALVKSKQGLDYVWWEGKQMLFLADYIDEYICDFWTDISTINLNKEGGVDLANGKKPEKLLKRIIQLVTKEGDIVMDYHLGSGTTAAVAHKMKRQFIGVEQLNYGENDSVVRLKNVINGDNSGISTEEDVQWKGGGEFVYLELKKYNQIFVEQIESAKDSNILLKIWEEMKAKSFLNYNVDLQKQEAHIEEFKALSLAVQKQHLLELLDKNQLYVNLSSLNDKDFTCTEEEKKVTKEFYQLKK